MKDKKRVMSLIAVRFKLFVRFLSFYWKANTVYGIHSPFVFELTEEVLDDTRMFYAFPIIEKIRGKLLKRKEKVSVQDYGAGSQVFQSTQRSIQKITQFGAVSPYVGRLLFRLVNHFKPLNILELGTSLGISTMYQSSASLNAKMVTIEGCEQTAKIAQENFSQTGMAWIQIINKSFTDGLPEAVNSLDQLDYVFLDGDHRAQSTLTYFESLLPHLHNDSVIVIADIYWSTSMMESWDTLKSHPSITLSVDCYHFGILFLRKEQQQKMHYKIVPKWWKPWAPILKH